MRLGAAHEAGMFLATVLAFLIVLLGGELPVVAWLVLGTPAVSAWLRHRGLAAPAGSGTALGAAALALGAAQVVSAGVDAAVLGGGIALLGLLTARMLTRQTLDHDLQALLLSLLLVLAGSVLNVGINYGVVFVAFSISAVWALTTRQLLSGAASMGVGDVDATLDAVKTRRDVITPAFLGATGTVALFVLATTALVFFLFPRIGVGGFGVKSQRSGQFPSAVSLRGSPRAAVGSGEIIARVQGVSEEAFFRGLYLRGGVYDEVTEAGFGQADRPPKLDGVERTMVRAEESGPYTVFLRPIAGELLFTLGGLTNAVSLAGGKANPSFPVRIAGTNTRGELVAAERLQSALRYEVRGGWASPGYVPDERGRRASFDDEEEARAFYLRVPEALAAGLDPLVAAIATEDLDRVAKARALRAHLLDNFLYTLDQPSGTAEQPLLDFLTNTRAGHCEYFATAFTAMLRQAGIPARVVGGYQGGKWDEANQTAVFYGYNAHAWVEWFLPGAGWVTDDPTPTARAPRGPLSVTEMLVERVRRFWDDTVLDYALTNQMDALRETRDFFSRFSSVAEPRKVVGVVVVILSVIALGVVWLRARRDRRQRGRREHPLAAGLSEAIRKVRGDPVSTSATLREAATSLPLGEARVVVFGVLELYEGDRFGGRPLPADQMQAALARLALLGDASDRAG